jgi:pilus assembly protein CpaE
VSDLPAASAAGSTRARKAAPIAKIFVSDQDSEGVIRQSLSDLGIDDAEFTKGTVETATADLATKASPNLLFVDLSGIEDPVARIYELAERCEPSVSVVAIGNRNDIILYRDLKNAGVSEYFFKPLIIDLVKATCNSVLSGGREKTTSPRTGKLVFVLGVRGGVGATTIAANAAWYLAEKGSVGSCLSISTCRMATRRSNLIRRRAIRFAKRSKSPNASTSSFSNAERYMCASVSICWRLLNR